METLRDVLMNDAFYSSLKGVLVEKKESFKRLPKK